MSSRIPTSRDKLERRKSLSSYLRTKTRCFPVILFETHSFSDMSSTKTDNRLLLPNMVLIAGNGRNVGKTTLACKIIKHLSFQHKIIGLKISPHFHSYNTNEVFIETESFVILQEKNKTSKDSSLMLQAGAQNVYYIMAKPESLSDAINTLLPFLQQSLIVCESGGLHEIAQPGLFFFVNYNNQKIVKPQLLSYAPKQIQNNGKDFTLQVENLTFSNNRIHLSA